jgi:stage V sporulation protein B
MLIKPSNQKDLQTLVFGTSIIIVSVFFLYLFRFIQKLIISRVFGPEGFGIFSIGEMVLNLATLFSLLGLQTGIKKFISHYRSLKENNSIKGIIFGSLKIILPLSILISLLILFFVPFISRNIFHDENLISSLYIFAMIIPFNALSFIISSVFMGMKRPKYDAITTTFGRNFFSLLFAGIAVYFGFEINVIFWTYFFSFIISNTLGVYLLKKKIFPLLKTGFSTKYHYSKLLHYSLPLFFSTFFTVVLGWTDTFFLGSLRNLIDVGVYNAVLSLSLVFSVFSTSLKRMFLPILGGLFAKKEFGNIGELYVTSARWIYLFSLPFLLIIFFYSQNILNLVYGSSYILGASSLLILMISSFFQSFIGPTNVLITIFEKTKFLLYSSVIITIFNIFLNIVLIPRYGVVGATIATSSCIILREIILIFKVRKLVKLNYRIIPFLKITVSGLLSIFLIRLNIFTNLLNLGSIGLFILSILFFFFFLIFLFVSKAFHSNDILALTLLCKRFKLPENKIKMLVKIIKKGTREN